MGDFFFGCNIPFSVVESQHFQEFCVALRPAYHPPSRKLLSTHILDEVHDKFCVHVEFEPNSVLLIDGWQNSSSNTKNVTCLLHSSTGEALFLENFDFSGEKETGDKLAEVVEKAKIKAQKEHATKIYAIVSDNASNMKCMGRSVNEWHLTCNSHTGQLLAKDIVPTQVANYVGEVLKAFSSPDAEHHILKQGGRAITLACETRWCSHRDSFVNLMKNLQFMKKVVAENTVKVKPHIFSLLYNEQFVKNVEDCIQLFNPVCNLINKCQSSTASIADAAEEWLKLELPEGYDEAETHLANRRKYALNVYCLAANFLHPQYEGKN